ncbi:MAG: nitrate reductase [Methylococcales bacterium]|jgi:nitrate reductase gamma subunit|nr:nitrate reductase [Methylococcales bacterium]MBT7444102.1 nitrate reductase [Methylococcales bacterium]
MFFTLIFTVLFYAAIIIFVGGLAFKIRQYWQTPAPLKIPTTPAPVTQSGVIYRMLKEVTIFESLFRSNKWIWLFGWCFHMGLFLVFARHLRYVVDWSWVALIQPFGIYAGFLMIFGLSGLLARRFLVERIRYISSPSDYLMLILLIAIAGSGLLMKFAFHTSVIDVIDFVHGLLSFGFHILPPDFLLYMHLLMVVGLMIIFPFSKLLHAPGVFFSPTRNQIDNPREKYHVAPWAAKLGSDKE